jgi:hypothetical protein
MIKFIIISEKMTEENKAPPPKEEVKPDEGAGGYKRIALIFIVCMLGDLLFRTFAGGQNKE